MRTRRTFDPEFKNQVVKFALKSNRTVTAIGKELGIGQNLLSQWVKEHQQRETQGPAAIEPEEMKRELARLREENTFLKNQHG